MHLLRLSLLLLLLPLLLPFHFSIARIADASHKRRLSTAIASAASASSRELDFLTRATADLESLALGERKPGVGTAAPRMIAATSRSHEDDRMLGVRECVVHELPPHVFGLIRLHHVVLHHMRVRGHLLDRALTLALARVTLALGLALARSLAQAWALARAHCAGAQRSGPRARVLAGHCLAALVSGAGATSATPREQH